MNDSQETLENVDTTVKHPQKLFMTNGFIFILAIACGGIAANLYYAQTLLSPIGHSINLAPSLIGLIVTLIQVGYVIGLLFIVPLADFTENRRLIVFLLCLSCLFLFGLAFIKIRFLFLLFCFLLGVSLVIPPIIIPFVSYILPVEKQGQAIGKIIGGLLLGATLARPLASSLAAMFSWNAIFIFSAVLMAILAGLFYCLLPKRTPEHRLSYWKLLSSMPSILKSYPVLRRRALYHAMLFGVFCLFWSSVAMLLSSHIFNYSQGQIALFAFAGAMGGFAAPIAGRIADKGWIKQGTAIAIMLVIAAFIIAKISGGHSIIELVISALLLDIGVASNLVLGQRALFSLAPEVRGRLNSLYVVSFFLGGAIGSAMAGYLFSHWGWRYIIDLGMVVSMVAFIYFLSEVFSSRSIK